MILSGVSDICLALQIYSDISSRQIPIRAFATFWLRLIDRIRRKNKGYEKVTHEKAELLENVEGGPNKKRTPSFWIPDRGSVFERTTKLPALLPTKRTICGAGSAPYWFTTVTAASVISSVSAG